MVDPELIVKLEILEKSGIQLVHLNGTNKKVTHKIKKLTFIDKIFKYDEFDSPYSEGIKKHFDKVFEDTPRFYTWWGIRSCEVSQRDGVFELASGKNNYWKKPWEFLLYYNSDLFDDNLQLGRINFVRRFSTPTIPVATTYSEPLRSLIIVGDSAGSLSGDITPLQDANAIVNAWLALPASFQTQIARPEVIENANIADIHKLLIEKRPHILWFSGHGTDDDKGNHLLFPNYQWVNSSALSKEIKKSKHKLLYAIFLACDTGKQNKTCFHAPLLVQDLHSVGVDSVLVMQAPLGDKVGPILASELFKNLANGLPLYKATSRARAHLLLNSSSPEIKFNWAVPAVWTSGNYVHKVSWNTDSTPAISYHLTALRSLRSQYKGSEFGRPPFFLEDPISAKLVERAKSWMGNKRLWIQCNESNDSVAYQIISYIQRNLITETKRCFVVDLKSDRRISNGKNIERMLNAWSKRISTALILEQNDMESFPEYNSLNDLQNEDTQTPWELILDRPELNLFILYPPDYNNDHWFWRAIDTGKCERIVIINDKESPNLPNPWRPDEISAEPTLSINKWYEKEKEFLLLMAYIQRPVPHSHCLLLVKSPNDFTEEYINGYLQSTSSGYFLKLESKSYIVEILSVEDVRLAHSLCAKYLNSLSIEYARIDIDLEEELLIHYQNSSNHALLLEQGEFLIHHYSTQGLPNRIILLITGVLSKLMREFDSWTSYRIAWSYMQLHDLTSTDIWLNRIVTREKSLLFEKNLLSAEYYKSLGGEENVDKALQLIDGSIKKLIGREKEKRRLLHLQHDRTRIIHYVSHDYDKAIASYKKIIRSVGRKSKLTPITKRNLAECYRNKAAIVTNKKEAQSLLRLAKSEIDEALSILTELEMTSLEVTPSIFYEKFKLSDVWPDVIGKEFSEKSKEILKSCIKVAKQGNHQMVLAVAENTMFWKYQKFTTFEWRKLANTLSRYTHGWAVRTSLNSHISAAKKVISWNDEKEAFKILLDAEKIINKFPHLRQGVSDKRRILLTYSGLQTLAKENGKNENYWQSMYDKFPEIKQYIDSLELKKTNPEYIFNQL